MNLIRMVALVLGLASTALADDWPQWLGPKRDGGSAETVTPWKSPPVVLWRHPVGPGYSVPIVADGRVYVHARVKDKEEEEVVAYDALSGSQLWRDAYSRPRYRSILNTGPQATPTLVAGRVYSFGINGLVTCYEAASGKRLWQVDVFNQIGADLPRYGVCCSPLVIGNRVLISVGGQGSSVVALDTEDGTVAWQAFNDPASTSSPVLFLGGTSGRLPDVVFMTGLRLIGVNPLDGNQNWEYPLVFQPSGASPTPLVAGNVIVTSTMTNGSTAIRVGADDAAASQVWQVKELSGYFSSGVIDAGERLFLITNSLLPIPSAALRCVDLKTGNELWKKDGVGYFHAGLIRTGNGNLLLLDDSGNLKLIEAAGKEYRELCAAKVCGGTLVCPALADGRVYVRDDKEVICLQLGP